MSHVISYHSRFYNVVYSNIVDPVLCSTIHDICRHRESSVPEPDADAAEEEAEGVEAPPTAGCLLSSAEAKPSLGSSATEAVLQQQHWCVRARPVRSARAPAPSGRESRARAHLVKAVGSGTRVRRWRPTATLLRRRQSQVSCTHGCWRAASRERPSMLLTGPWDIPGKARRN